MGSVAEWQEIFRRAEKPPFRFWHRTWAPVLAETGWEPERRLASIASQEKLQSPFGAVAR